jgi:hypothetical protein
MLLSEIDSSYKEFNNGTLTPADFLKFYSETKGKYTMPYLYTADEVLEMLVMYYNSVEYRKKQSK